MIIAFVGQKGGSGKSTMARLLAQQAADLEDMTVHLADMDVRQRTSVKWAERRRRNGLSDISCTAYEDVPSALEGARGFRLLIFDAKGLADPQTLEIAQTSDLTVIPTSPGVDSLEEAVLLVHELTANGIGADHIRFALFATRKEAPRKRARALNYLQGSGVEVLGGELPHMASYEMALDAGRSPAETVSAATGEPLEGLNKAAVKLADAIADALIDAATPRKD